MKTLNLDTFYDQNGVNLADKNIRKARLTLEREFGFQDGDQDIVPVYNHLQATVNRAFKTTF